MKIIKYELTVAEAKRALRKAKKVYANVIFFKFGDGSYVEITKKIARDAIGGGNEDIDITSFMLADNGDIYIN